TLQLGLLAMGVAVIGAVWAYNAWLARRTTPRRSSLSQTADHDSEPTESEPQAGGLDPEDRLEPVLDEALDAPVGAAPTGAALSDRRWLMDPLIDCMVTLSLEQWVSGEAVLAALPRSRRVGTKPFAAEGLNTTTQEWEVPRVGQRYEMLQAGVQLANRAGPLNEIEFSEFVRTAQTFADVLGAGLDLPDMMDEVARARELDQFAGAHDAQLTFNVRAMRASWSPGYLAQHAANQGFVAGALPGRMVLPGAETGQAPVLVLRFETQAALADDPDQTALRTFDLTLDVAHVPRSEQPFVRLRTCALALAAAMDGRVTDGSGQDLHNDAMDAIGADLEGLYDALEAHDLAAGSYLARRLFS
ncbi:MAG: hypothetical protein RJA09_2004, partial [Pseudomonadota bacterium]